MKTTIAINFTVEHETHNREQWVKNKHFLPPLRNTDVHGDPDYNGPERKWGDTVHVLRIPHIADPSISIVRVMSDSLEDATVKLQAIVPEQMQALWSAQMMQKQMQYAPERLNETAIRQSLAVIRGDLAELGVLASEPKAAGVVKHARNELTDLLVLLARIEADRATA